MVAEDGAVDGHHHVVVVHLLEQGRDARGGHEPRPPGHTLHRAGLVRAGLVRAGQVRAGLVRAGLVRAGL